MMNMDKMTQWLELARQCSHDGFWDGLDVPTAGDAVRGSREQPQSPPKEAAGPKPSAATPPAWSPPVHMYRSGLQAWVWVELPGIRKEDLEVLYQGQSIVLKGAKADRMLLTDCPVAECYFGAFERRIDLPFPVVLQSASAKLAEGILLIRFTLPAVTETRIPVE